MPLLEHFDLLAPVYDRLIRPPDPDVLRRIGRFPVEGALLDAGGGTGRVAETLSDMASHVIVADLSAGMLKQATRKYGLQTVESLTEVLPFADHSFARVIMVDSLHHVFSQERTALELWRVIKPGGIIVIEEPDIRTFSVKLVALAEKLALMRSKFLSPENIAQLFDRTKSKVHIEREGYTAWVVVEKI